MVLVLGPLSLGLGLGLEQMGLDNKSDLYSQYSKKKGVMYLKCDTADCKGTAKIDQGLQVQYMQIPRRPIYCQNPLLVDVDSITCKFIQPHSIC